MFTTRLMDRVFSVQQAQAVVGDASLGLTAAGTNQATALALVSPVSAFSTVSAGTGCILPASLTPGDRAQVYNGGASTLLVYPPVGGQISLAGTNVGVPVGAGQSAQFQLFSKDGLTWAVTNPAGAVIASTGTFTGNVTVGGTLGVTGASTLTGDVTLPSINGGQLAGLRNRLINGDFRIDYRAQGASVSSGALSTYNYVSADRWAVDATGAAVTVQRTGSAGSYALVLSGAASNTGCFLAQRIESVNIADLASKSVTFSVTLSANANMTVAWFLNRANATDNFGATTQLGTGTWAVTTTPTRFTFTVTLDSSSANGIMPIISPNNTGAFTSGSLTVANAQLENGSSATPFEFRSHSLEEALCARYLPAFYASSNTWWGCCFSTTTTQVSVPFRVPARIAPTGITISAAGDFLVVNSTGATGAATAVSLTAGGTGTMTGSITATTTAGTPTITAGSPGRITLNTGTAKLLFTGCEL